MSDKHEAERRECYAKMSEIKRRHMIEMEAEMKPWLDILARLPLEPRLVVMPDGSSFMFTPPEKNDG